MSILFFLGHINILTFLFSSKALIINGFIKIENVKILLSTYLYLVAKKLKALNGYRIALENFSESKGSLPSSQSLIRNTE